MLIYGSFEVHNVKVITLITSSSHLLQVKLILPFSRDYIKSMSLLLYLYIKFLNF